MPKNAKPEETLEEELVIAKNPNANGATDNAIVVETGGWEDANLLPPGDYPAVLVGIEQATSSKGNPMLVWDFVLVRGQYAGREFRTWTVLNASSAWKLREVLVATALGQLGDTLRFVYDDYVNLLVTLRLKTDMYNDQKRTSVEKVLPPSEGAGTKWTKSVPNSTSSAEGPSIGAPSMDDDGNDF